MIDGGNATIYVSDINRSIEFYTKTLGLTLRMRVDDHWAEIDAGSGFIVGLHPATPHTPKPGNPGATRLGLNVTKPLDDVVSELKQKGVPIPGPIMDDGNVKLAFLADPDGNPFYLFEVIYSGQLS